MMIRSLTEPKFGHSNHRVLGIDQLAMKARIGQRACATNCTPLACRPIPRQIVPLRMLWAPFHMATANLPFIRATPCARRPSRLSYPNGDDDA